MDRYLEMASSSNQAGEFERMMAIVEQMMSSRDNDASVEKALERVVEIEGRFDGRNITKFLDAYKREMNQMDVSEARQISSFKRVVTVGKHVPPDGTGRKMQRTVSSQNRPRSVPTGWEDRDVNMPKSHIGINMT